MEKHIEEVLKNRNKIFESLKYKDFKQVLDSMQIPNIFDYNDCIPKIFEDKYYKTKINTYEIGKYKELYDVVNKDRLEKKIDKNKDILFLVHPFYPIIRHANFLIKDKDYYIKYKRYEENIKRLIESNNYNIILFDSPDNFARYTYTLFEYDSIKKIIFTEHSTGKILQNEETKKLKDYNKIFIAGCYANECLLDVENQFTSSNFVRVENSIIERCNTFK